MTGQYEERIVAFVDILGFKELVQKSETNAVELDQILDVLQKIAELKDPFETGELLSEASYPKLSEQQKAQILKNLNEQKDKPDAQVQITRFSDCVAISVHKTPFGYTLLKFCFAKLAALLFPMGVLLRGGIAVGSVIHTPELIFGPAFIEAYKLESEKAKMPRVIFSAAAYEEVAKFKSSGVEIKDEVDGFYFVDLLSLGGSRFSSNAFSVAPIDWARGVGRNIEKQLQNVTDYNVYLKYHWFKMQYDALVKKYPALVSD